MMNESEIRKYAALMRDLGLTGLELREGESVVRLERTETRVVREELVQAPAARGTESARESAGETLPDGSVEVRSPMVGVFYRAPAENSAPFVKIGDHINKGDVLGIIEAMKLMNELPAEFGGTITDVCVGNGEVVDYGHLLFRVRKD